MKIIQKKTEYQPIMIKLETQEEANAMLSIIDCLKTRDFSNDESKLIIDLSNAFGDLQFMV